MKALVSILSVVLFAASFARAADKPNIILIMADDLGYETLGVNGGTSYPTPVLDGLAETGMRFEHCYSQPLCTPSRVQIMTGIYNVRNYAKFGVLPKGETTFAHLLKENGYATCIVGKWQLGNDAEAPREFGFDEFCLWQHTVKGNSTDGHDNRFVNPTIDFNGKTKRFMDGSFGPDVCADFALDFMEEHKEEPFMVYYPMILTHCPFIPTPGSPDWDPKSKGSPTYKGDAKYFGSMVTYMDKIVGRIVDKLDTLGLRENTLILFTGDNGTDVPVVSIMDGRLVAGQKGHMNDAGTRVPLIANWPGTIPRGQVSKDLVDFSDFLPTICDATGANVPSDLNIDGRSFLPQLKGQPGNPRDWIYCWYSRNGAAAKSKEWARNQRYKLYRTGELYDVGEDVLEMNPLRKLSPQTREIRSMLQHVLDQFENARPER